jgi:hypothetical protein
MNFFRAFFAPGLLSMLANGSTASVAETKVRPDTVQRPSIKIPPSSSNDLSRMGIRDWDERGAPKCLAISSLRTMLVTHKDSVDLMTSDGQFFRAKLEKGCASADFYAGLYLRPTRDGRLCEDRDRVLTRSGGECEIAKFKVLRSRK